MDPAIVIITIIILFIGGVVLTMWGELQNVDRIMWQSNNELKNKIRNLEDEIIDLNKTIKVLKETDSETPEEKNVSS